MRVEDALILSNERIAEDIWRMEIKTSLAKEASPGQFLEIQVPPFFLRRPISICEIKDDSLVIIYKVVGEGTLKMTEMTGSINIFGPCGNGFPEVSEDVVLIGGGVGIPPLYEVAKRAVQGGHHVDVVLGFRNASQVFYEAEFKALGCNVVLASDDGSVGVHGTVLDAIEQKNIKTPTACSCGPLPMLKGVQSRYAKGAISLEARMACGIGACMGCIVKTPDGHSVRVCKDGPVFGINEVVL